MPGRSGRRRRGGRVPATTTNRGRTSRARWASTSATEGCSAGAVEPGAGVRGRARPRRARRRPAPSRRRRRPAPPGARRAAARRTRRRPTAASCRRSTVVDGGERAVGDEPVEVDAAGGDRQATGAGQALHDVARRRRRGQQQQPPDAAEHHAALQVGVRQDAQRHARVVVEQRRVAGRGDPGLGGRHDLRQRADVPRHHPPPLVDRRAPRRSPRASSRRGARLIAAEVVVGVVDRRRRRRRRRRSSAGAAGSAGGRTSPAAPRPRLTSRSASARASTRAGRAASPSAAERGGDRLVHRDQLPPDVLRQRPHQRADELGAVAGDLPVEARRRSPG